ncbi:hypothetical protein pdam_00023217 [Pocillopora damicornis]|uniref:Uncharacterized protein n=1 Tax=Pocillopora damicornis TaxID=46731 RepID=A0A3M6UN12_POCDA|nr:hypothetical protein pdam_00023217 [Pocillopora damicornis]
MTTMSERLQIKRIRGYYKNNLSTGHLNVNCILGKIDPRFHQPYYLTHIIASYTETESEALVVY